MWKRLAVLWTVVRGDARLLWMALRHPRAPVMDDIMIVPLVIRWLLNRLPADIRTDIEGRAGFWAGGKSSASPRGSSGYLRDSH